MQSNNASTTAEHREATARQIDGLFEAPKGRRHTLDGTRVDRLMTVAQIVAAHDQLLLKQLKHRKQVPENPVHLCALRCPWHRNHWSLIRRAIAFNDAPQGRAQNRRVEIEVTSHEK